MEIGKPKKGYKIKKGKDVKIVELKNTNKRLLKKIRKNHLICHSKSNPLRFNKFLHNLGLHEYNTSSIHSIISIPF